MRKKLGDILMEEGFIDATQLSAGLGEQEQWGGKLGAILVRKGFISEGDLVRGLAIQQGIRCVLVGNMEISPGALKCLKPEVARKHNVIPIALEENTLIIAMPDPTDLKTIDNLGFITGKKIKIALALDKDIGSLIDRFYDKSYLEGSGYRPPAGGPYHGTGIAEESPRKAGGGGITVEHTLASLIKLLVRKGLISEQELLRVIKEPH